MTALTSVRVVEGDARHFGEFDLIAKLGRGGMAEAFLAARRSKPAEILVVKRLTPDFADDAEHRAMFEEEMRVMPLFSHPNVVRTFEVGEQDGQKFLAMEFLDGLPLDQCADAVRGVGQSAAIHLVCELLDGLHYVHELRGPDGAPLDVVHRDVSPHNVFVTYEGRVTLVDFGIAKSRGRAKHTSTGVVRGKLSYMAPEQALCDEVDRRADVFAAGVILWELLSGRRFWEGLSEVQILKRMTFGDLPKAADIPDLSDALRGALAHALAIKPEDRFPTARAFKEELVRLAGAPLKRAVLGSAVAAGAAEYRDALRAVIDAHLMAARGTEGLPGVDPAADERGARAVEVAASDTIEAPPPSLSPLEAAVTAEAGVEVGPRSARRTPEERAMLETGGASTLVLPIEKPRPRLNGARMVWAAVVAGVVLGSGFAIFRAAWSTPPTAQAAKASEIPVEAAAPLVQLKLSVIPPDAAVFFDDLLLTELPFVAKLKRDSVAHSLRVEAPGYVPHSRMVVLEEDVEIHVELEKAPEARPAPTPALASAAKASALPRASSRPKQPPPTPPTPPNTGSSGADKRNPWGKKN